MLFSSLTRLHANFSFSVLFHIGRRELDAENNDNMNNININFAGPA